MSSVKGQKASGSQETGGHKNSGGNTLYIARLKLLRIAAKNGI